MQYKSMVLLFVTMLAIVFAPGWALGKTKYVVSECSKNEKIAFANLVYIGQKVDSTNYGDCKKVEPVSSDATAVQACSQTGYRYYLNPGNPQYQSPYTEEYGSQGANKLGYYFCLSNFSKQKMCEAFANDPKFNYLHARWERTSDKDGNCLCGTNPKQMHDCGNGIPPLEGDADKAKCEKLGGDYHPKYKNEAASCQCKNDNLVLIDVNSSNSCPEPKETTAAVPGEESQQIKDCVAKFEVKLNECKDLGEKAVAACDQNNESNKSVDTAKNFVSTISNLFIQKAAGTGAQGQCAGANLLAAGTYKLMNDLKGNCETEITTCKNKCDEIKEGLPAFCKSEVTPVPSAPNGETPDDKYLAEQNKKYAPLVIENQKVCGIKAVKKEDLLRDALRAYDSAAKSAATCACKLSAAGADCTAIPSPADCNFNPSLPTCNGPGALNCVVGSSDYALPKCLCLQDSSLPFCQAPAGKVPFAFAGDLKALGPGGGGGVFSGGGGGGDSGMDLGGLSQQDARTDSKLAPQGDAPGIGVNPVTGNSGGGGGSGGDGAGAPTADAGGEPAEKNMGLMGMVKSAVGNMFGSKPGSAANNKTPNKGLPGYDVDKWRPRGLASTGCNVSQIRCKNEDIFSIVNKRYLNNEMSFIQNP